MPVRLVDTKKKKKKKKKKEKEEEEEEEEKRKEGKGGISIAEQIRGGRKNKIYKGKIRQGKAGQGKARFKLGPPEILKERKEQLFFFGRQDGRSGEKAIDA